jgi:hypothetical protein
MTRPEIQPRHYSPAVTNLPFILSLIWKFERQILQVRYWYRLSSPYPEEDKLYLPLHTLQVFQTQGTKRVSVIY